MTDAAYPPLSLRVHRADVISDRQARKSIDAFLKEYAQRPSGVDAAVKTRLEKLSAAIKEGANAKSG